MQGAIDLFAEGLNNKDEIVGYFYDSSSFRHGFLDSGGVFSTIDIPASFTDPLSPTTQTTQAWGINDSGQIVGNFSGLFAGEPGSLLTPVTPPPYAVEP